MFEPMTEAEAQELNYATNPLGSSSRAICKVSNGNVCGSGTLVGKRNGKSLVLTNAHVAGTRIGKTMRCTFPHANTTETAKVIMAGYSDRIMMDWAVLEISTLVDLPHIKLKNEVPSGEHYTGGYPRCRGPYYQRLRTRAITHSGTVWRWQPDSIGGQSGSGVHSFEDNLQYGLLTWSWGGDGAGQTTRSIWFQYINRAAVGFPKPPGMIELAENRAEDLEEGFFSQSNITTLPIWDHLDGGGDDGDDDEPDQPGEGDPELAAKLLQEAEQSQKQASRLAELAKKYAGEDDDDEGQDDDGGGNDCDPDNPPESTGPLFGL